MNKKKLLEILQETAKKMDSLYREAIVALHNKDTVLYRQKLIERAKLLIGLPARLSGIKISSEKIKYRVQMDTSYFASSAKEALKMKTSFGLEALLTHKGQKVGDDDDLKKLIAFVKKSK